MRLKRRLEAHPESRSFYTKSAFKELGGWIAALETTSCAALKKFVIKEAETYIEGNYTCYSVDEYAITVFTDTTERAPTFNLAPFDNPKNPTGKSSLTYISIPTTSEARSAWQHLLARAARPINWPEVHEKTSDDYLYSFDFSANAMLFRKTLVPSAEHHLFTIGSSGDHLTFRFRDLEERFALFGQSPLLGHLTLKMLLNMHSTLVMGRLNRFEGNLMTWVYPSNGKLIDRAARYTQILLKARGLDFSYDEIVRAQFVVKAELSPKESIVHKTIERLISAQTQQPESRAQR